MIETGSKASRAIPPLYPKGSERVVSNSSSLASLLPITMHEIRRVAAFFARQSAARPGLLLRRTAKYLSDEFAILRGASLHDAGKNARFKDPRWEQSGYYRRLQQSWLALAHHAGELLSSLDLNQLDERRIRFLLTQMTSALSPANFLFTNPEVIEKTFNSRGTNLLLGIRRLLDDCQNNSGLPTQVDKNVFTPGKNLATTPGQVIFRADLFELIQYRPSTERQHQRPVLLVSSFINRSYIFDLKPGRSLVENLLDDGYGVYLIAWNNPGVEHHEFGLEDYVQAIIVAGEVVRSVSRTNSFNLAGICGGAQLVAIATVVLQHRRRRWVSTLTMISFVLDPHSEDTDPGAWCTETTVLIAKHNVRKKKFFSAAALNWNMNLLQPERLLWSTVVDYYLLGKDPSVSEVMYWMNDQVNVSERMYQDEIDIMLRNPLPRTGALNVLGVPIDLSKITVDSYHLAPYHDHVMPWHGMFRNASCVSGSAEFVVTNGGHITPCITRRDNVHARYFTNDGTYSSAEDWLRTAKEHRGSWLDHWTKWLTERSGPLLKSPRSLGNKKHAPLCAAPGSYVTR